MHGDTIALVVRVRGAGWTPAYLAKSKLAEESKAAVHDSKGPANVDLWYPDGAPGLHAACRDEGIRHDKAGPHRSETNGVIERTNRAVIQGARTLLFQSGLPYKYWRSAMKCFCSLYNFEHVDKKKGTVAYKQTHGEMFQGKLIPYGARIRYLPAAERELQKREKLDASLRDAIFVGYRMHSGGRWTGQYLILDVEAYTEIPDGSHRCAYERATSGI